jgi:AcrR family transcriptional regulator
MASSNTLDKVYGAIGLLREQGVPRLDVGLVARTAGVARSTFYLEDDDWEEVRAVIKGKPSNRISLALIDVKEKSGAARRLEALSKRVDEAETEVAHMQSAAQKVYHELIDEVQRWFIKASEKPAQQAKTAKYMKELASSRTELQHLRAENEVLRAQVATGDTVKQFVSKKIIHIDTLEPPGSMFTSFLEQLDSLAPQIRMSGTAVIAYVLCGLPCSGKSRWVESHRPESAGLHIYIDSYAQSADIRSFLATRLRANAKAAVVCVWLRTGEETCNKRAAASSAGLEKLMRESEISKVQLLFENPTLDEPFDLYMTPREIL